MQITRNTKYYKSTVKDISNNEIDILYRELNILELSFLDNINSQNKKFEISYDLAVDKEYNILWPTKLQIGELILVKSLKIVADKDLFEITIKNMREKISNDTTINMITHITQVFPGTSILELFKLNHKDLIELTCICENMTNKRIFDLKKLQPKTGLKEFPDDGKTLQEKMNELQQFYRQ